MKKILSVLLLFVSLKAISQGFEIRAVNTGNGTIGVEMRTTGIPVTIVNQVTDIVFGLKWQSSYSVDLTEAITTDYNIRKSGGRKLKNNYHYQAFYAANTPFPFPAAWPQNNWIEIMRIPVAPSAAATFEICETGFDPTTDPNLSIDLPGDYTPLINGVATLVPLPVSLINFEVVPQEKAIRLSWQTASETNNKGFIVQRSKDGIAFDSIGWVGGRGTTSSPFSYGFTDAQVERNLLYYYRLKQVDIDNKVSFSSIKSAKLRGEGPEIFGLSPNPVAAVLKLVYLGNTVNEKVHIKVIDNKGSIVTDVEKVLIPGTSVNIDVSVLAGGAYYLAVERNKETLFSKAFQKL